MLVEITERNGGGGGGGERTAENLQKFDSFELVPD